MALPQQFSISLNGVTYNLRLTYCPPANCWLMDILDIELNPILQGIPLVTGSTLLSQYAYLEFPGDFLVLSSPNPDQVPSFVGLGTTGQLYYLPPGII